MLTNVDKLTSNGCDVDKKDKVCRSKGGESCAFDGAMIVLQPIADTAHIVHGPIACCGNSWEGRGTLSTKGSLFRMGFTTDISEMDIVYGSEKKLYSAIFKAYAVVKPKAIFVYATCVSGLIGEDIESVCRGAEKKLGIPVIPVNAPGFVGPKNLGNRIAGEVLLDHVIGTGEAPSTTDYDINLIGEYNIAGDLWLIEPVLKQAGIRILSRITGDATFEEITYAHRAKLNVVVCSRALINIAKEMEKRYGIPYIEVSFFGKTEMSKSLRMISSGLCELRSSNASPDFGLCEKVETVIERQESLLSDKLKCYSHLNGKKAVLYTGGVKSWSFISALLDLGIEVVAVGTKKSTVEDEEKMRRILGSDAHLVKDVTPKNLLRLMSEKKADILIAGGRNQYLAVKEGFPFVDVNQERHIAYAGYDGLVNLAEQISNGIKFYTKMKTHPMAPLAEEGINGCLCTRQSSSLKRNDLVIDPIKHSQSIGAAIAFQGIHKALPIIHGAQGCSFLAKVLLTKHFKDPIALASTKLFTEDVVMGSEEIISKVVGDFIKKSSPDIIGILSSGLSEVKGDDIESAIKEMRMRHPQCNIFRVSTPDYDGGLETGYAKAVEAVLRYAARGVRNADIKMPVFQDGKQINILAGSHLTPEDFTELREIVTSFGLRPILLPDLSSLDGSRQGFSALAVGGATMSDIESMSRSEFTIVVGSSMEPAAQILRDRFGLEYCVFEGLFALKDVDTFMETLSLLGGKSIPSQYERQRRILTDGMRDAHFYYGNKKVCLALEVDHSVQIARLLDEMGADIRCAVIPVQSVHAGKIQAREVTMGDLYSIEGDFDVVISNSHATDTAKRLGAPLYQTGFPVYKILGNTAKVTIGYKGALTLLNEIGNLLIKEAH